MNLGQLGKRKAHLAQELDRGHHITCIIESLTPTILANLEEKGWRAVMHEDVAITWRPSQFTGRLVHAETMSRPNGQWAVRIVIAELQFVRPPHGLDAIRIACIHIQNIQAKLPIMNRLLPDVDRLLRSHAVSVTYIDPNQARYVRGDASCSKLEEHLTGLWAQPDGDLLWSSTPELRTNSQGAMCTGFLLAASAASQWTVWSHGTWTVTPADLDVPEKDGSWHRLSHITLQCSAESTGWRRRSEAALQKRAEKRHRHYKGCGTQQACISSCSESHATSASMQGGDTSTLTQAQCVCTTHTRDALVIQVHIRLAVRYRFIAAGAAKLPDSGRTLLLPHAASPIGDHLKQAYEYPMSVHCAAVLMNDGDSSCPCVQTFHKSIELETSNDKEAQ